MSADRRLVLNCFFRPNEHHVYDILHWVKASFKKQALDEIKDYDCFNKEAFRL